jgi:MFS transporter, DHA1 family, multidrug resistance protein
MTFLSSTRPGTQVPGLLHLSIVLSALMAFAPFAIDMYLPALPAIGDEFGVPQSSVQWSLSSFLAGFGIGQLFWGPVGDRWGRRMPIMAGIALYVAACIGCAMAEDAGRLAVWRFVQAIGACAAPVLARAMVRDLYEKEQAARMLSLLMLVMALAPMLAPLAGGQVLAFWNWRAIFWCLGGLGLLAALGLLSLPETLPRERRVPASPAGMAAGYGRLLRSPVFMSYAASGAFIYGGMFAYISGTPFVYIEHFGVSPQVYGFLFGVNAVGMMVTNAANRRLIPVLGSDRILLAGACLSAGFGVLLVLAAATGAFGLAGIAIPILLYVSMMGLVSANAMAGAMSVQPGMAGSASAMAGALQFAFGAVAGTLVGWLADGTPVPMAGVIAVMGIGCAVSTALPALRRAKRRG